MNQILLNDVLESRGSAWDVPTHAPGPSGALPLTPDLLRYAPSGNMFGLTQDAGMGWNPAS